MRQRTGPKRLAGVGRGFAGRGRAIARAEGVAMVEATIGIVMILFVALLFMQVLIVFHATLAAHAAAQRAARDGALSGDPTAGTQTAAALQGNTIRIVEWRAPTCAQAGNVMKCTVIARVPSMVPGGGLFMGGGWSGVEITETGQYPMFDRGG